MPKFEYIHITAEKGGEDQHWRPTFINENQVKDWKQGEPLPQLINNMGAEGWELVSEYIDSSPDQTRYEYFWFDAPCDWIGKTPEGIFVREEAGFVEYVNGLGKDHWEMVTCLVPVNAGKYLEKYFFLFKRPITRKILRLRFKRELA